MHRWLLATAIAGCALADHVILNDFQAYQELPRPEQTYKTTSFTSPIFNIGKQNLEKHGTRSNHLFMTLKYDQAGPYIFRSEDLSLVYADPTFSYALNARVQILEGQPYLTFWHGAWNRGDSQGYCVFLDDHYQVKYNVTTTAPLHGNADMHECQTTPDGHVLLTSYQDKPFDLSSVGGEADGLLADSCFQEIDVRTGEARFTWCASEHYSPGLTYWRYSGVAKGMAERGDGDATSVATSSGFDAYHINSVQKTSDGNYLVSLRNLNSVVYVDGTSGQTIWNLGGKLNDFKETISRGTFSRQKCSGGALEFAWQHDARFWDNALSRLTLFDNHGLSTEVNCTDNSCSRGLELHINQVSRTVECVREYKSPSGLRSVIFGSMHPLPYPYESTVSQHRYLVNWGVHAAFTKYEDGQLIRDVQFSSLYDGHSVGGEGVESYRIYIQPWVGRPLWPPSVAADDQGTIWVSWNGATEVSEWAVYGADNAYDLGESEGRPRPGDRLIGGMYPRQPLFGVARNGFETMIELGPERPAYIKMAALDGNGITIGYTETVMLRSENSRYWVQDRMSFLMLSNLLI